MRIPATFAVLPYPVLSFVASLQSTSFKALRRLGRKKFWRKFSSVHAVCMDEQNDEGLMTYGDAATFLGISERTLERYVSERRVPFIQLPRRGRWSGIRFLRSQLLHWLEQRTVKPTSRTA